ncbi:unnamed protein product [Allacma fusca]|uniref:RNA polymerase I-specific transcription initiation factor RRN3 n=1 Tax=Allacma fusca TaxID=39272 RepID=A0A8J2K6W2_9HEXA|nr:unnamed protein product [Allacma fusca]
MARYSGPRGGPKVAPNSDRNFLKVLESLEATISSLDEKKSPVIQEILAGDWLMMSGKVVKKVEYFLSELLVVRPIFCRTVIRELVCKFITPPTDIEPANPDEISLSERKVFAILHRNLKKIFDAFPTYEEYGVKTMSSLFPYMTRGPHVHYCYVSNLLTCIGYMPHSKMQILHIIIHKLGKIDSSIRRQDVEALNENIEASKDLDDKVKLEDGGFENIDFFHDDSFVPNPLIDTLDVSLQGVFEFFEQDFRLLNEESVKTNDKAEVLNYFKNYVNCVFDKELLPCFGTKHAQFLFFYATSLQPEFPQIFLDSLWRKVDSVSTPAVLRIQAMSYISGFLTRAQYISFKTVKRWLTKLADWANEYVIEKSYGCHWASINLQAHGCFYAVCQTIFYLIAFRNKELLGSRKASAYMRTLNLGRLVTSDLNPLKACNSAISDAFVDALNQHQISYCRTILERNQRSTIPTVNAGLDDIGNFARQVTSSTLECFFPCDPYLLPRTKKWIDPIYKTYEPYLPEVKIEKEERDHGHDVVDMELSCSFSSDSPLGRGSLKLRGNILDSLEFMDC